MSRRHYTKDEQARILLFLIGYAVAAAAAVMVGSVGIYQGWTLVPMLACAAAALSAAALGLRQAAYAIVPLPETD